MAPHCKRSDPSVSINNTVCVYGRVARRNRTLAERETPRRGQVRTPLCRARGNPLERRRRYRLHPGSRRSARVVVQTVDIPRDSVGAALRSSPGGVDRVAGKTRGGCALIIIMCYNDAAYVRVWTVLGRFPPRARKPVTRHRGRGGRVGRPLAVARGGGEVPPGMFVTKFS